MGPPSSCCKVVSVTRMARYFSSVALEIIDRDTDALEAFGQGPELLEVFDDLRGDDARLGEVGGVLKALIAQPEGAEVVGVSGR